VKYDLELKGGPIVAPRIVYDGKAKIRKNVNVLADMLKRLPLSDESLKTVDNIVGQTLAELVKL